MGLLNLFNKAPDITTVSGCRTIHGIKRLDKSTLFVLQALAMPGSKRGKLTAEQIIGSCDSILTRTSTIINDCKKLISSTENPKIFFERYDLLLEKYSEMAKYEPYVEVYGYQPNESLNYYRIEKPKFEKKIN